MSKKREKKVKHEQQRKTASPGGESELLTRKTTSGGEIVDPRVDAFLNDIVEMSLKHGLQLGIVVADGVPAFGVARLSAEHEPTYIASLHASFVHAPLDPPEAWQTEFASQVKELNAVELIDMLSNLAAKTAEVIGQETEKRHAWKVEHIRSVLLRRRARAMQTRQAVNDGTAHEQPRHVRGPFGTHRDFTQHTQPRQPLGTGPLGMRQYLQEMLGDRIQIVELR